MIYFGYDECDASSMDGIDIRLPTRSMQRHYVWHFWLPYLIMLNPDRYRAAPLEELVDRNIPFIYPIELRWHFIEWLAEGREDDFLSDHVPELVLQAVRAGQAVILINFAHEARQFVYRKVVNGELRSVYDDLLSFVTTRRLPPQSVWLLNGDGNFADYWQAWKKDKGIDQLPQNPFEVRHGDLFFYLMQSLRRSIINGIDFTTTFFAEPTGSSLGQRVSAFSAIKRAPKPSIRRFYQSPERSFQDDVQDKLFLCMNNAYRLHRLCMTVFLKKEDLLEKSLVSFRMGEHQKVVFGEVDMQMAWEALNKQLPLTIDDAVLIDHIHTTEMTKCDNSIMTGIYDDEPYRRTSFNITNETEIHDDVCFLSEKTWKAVISCRPFVIMGTPGTLKYLRQKGFMTFEKYLDESYDNIKGFNGRFLHVSNIIKVIGNLSHQQLTIFKNSVRPILNHNLHVFATTRTEMETTIDDMWRSLST